MRRTLLVAMGLLGLSNVATAQETRSRGSKFEWPPIRIMVISDGAAGVELYLFLDQSATPGTQAMTGRVQNFTPAEAVAWVAAAESSLADSTRFHPVTLLAHDSSALVVARGRMGTAAHDSVVLAYYPRPDTIESLPIDIQLTSPQATAFLEAFRDRSLESHYDPAAPRSDSTFLTVLALMRPYPEVLSMPPLQYPEEMRVRGMEGTVQLRLIVDTLGQVEVGSVEVVSGSNPEFVAAAKAAVLKARFRPAQLNGRAVRSQIVVPVRFTLTHHL